MKKMAVTTTMVLACMTTPQAQPTKVAQGLRLELKKVQTAYDDAVRVQLQSEKTYRMFVSAGRCERIEDRDHATPNTPTVDPEGTFCATTRKHLDEDLPKAMRVLRDDLVRIA